MNNNFPDGKQEKDSIQLDPKLANQIFIPKAEASKEEVIQRPRNEMYLMSTGSARKMMLDSGASHYMVHIDDSNEEELATRRDLSTPIAMRSATQVIWVTECVDIWIYELGITVVASLTEIDGCPCVLSLGKLLDQNGFDFIWRSCKTPYIVKDKLRVYCHTHHDVQFISFCKKKSI